MAAVRVVASDPALPHQIALRVLPGQLVEVSCTCRTKRRLAAFGQVGQKTAAELYLAGPHITTDGPFVASPTGRRRVNVL